MYLSHRRRMLDLMEEGDVAVFPGARLALRNHDVEYPFRQQSDFLYLTGLREPEAVLLLAQGVSGLPEELLLLRERDPAQETWDGPRLGIERACSEFGFAAAAPIQELEQRLREALAGARRLWYRLGEDSRLDGLVTRLLPELRRRIRQGVEPPAVLLDPTSALHELRLFKDAEELACMRRAAAVTAEAHTLAMAHTAPGVGEWEIEALLNFTFRRHGCEGWAYPPIVAGGANACVLHYTSNDQVLQAGELVLVDAGSECSGYAADVTRTWPVGGRFQGVQRDLYQLVLSAQEKAIAAIAPGSSVDAVHDAAVRELAEGLRSLGVLQEPLSEVLEKKLYRAWYMHNTSHWLGLDVHDAGRYLEGDSSRPLGEGMVMTVEPGLYFRPDDTRAPEPLRGLGVRIEDDVLVTAHGHEVLSQAAPKKLDDVEAACSARCAVPPDRNAQTVRS